MQKVLSHLVYVVYIKTLNGGFLPIFNQRLDY